MGQEQRWREKQKLHDKAGGKCEYCKRYLPLEIGTIDHYVPTSAGGPNSLANKRWCCRACNLAKGALMPSVWERVRPQVLPPKRSPDPRKWRGGRPVRWP